MHKKQIWSQKTYKLQTDTQAKLAPLIAREARSLTGVDMPTITKSPNFVFSYAGLELKVIDKRDIVNNINSK